MNNQKIYLFTVLDKYRTKKDKYRTKMDKYRTKMDKYRMKNDKYPAFFYPLTIYPPPII